MKVISFSWNAREGLMGYRMEGLKSRMVSVEAGFAAFIVSMNAMFRLLTTILILILPAFSLTARADFFQYTDRDGTVVMVDDESKIPRKYRKQTRTTKADPGGESKTTAVRVKNNQVLVPVRISYRNTTVDAWLLLDTGATTTVISTDLAERLGIKPASTQHRLAQVADGRVVQTFRTRVDNIAVGPKSKHSAEVSIVPSNGPDMGFDGLLGMNFLGDFPHRLDVNSQLIEWQQ
jgi:clan AA aspartic protease (TIGR02281 family)